MERLTKLYVYAQSWWETVMIRLDRRTMRAVAEAERDIAAGRVTDYPNWGCGL